jgi:diacylglycerol kinase family enzyme
MTVDTSGKGRTRAAAKPRRAATPKAKPASAAKAKPLSPAAARLRKIELVANPASGSVGPGAVAEAEAILASYGLTANIQAPEPSGIPEALEKAVAARPDLLIILAGDGTARSAASLCGAQGALIAPLPGGTMNMLPHALYGVKTWQAALEDVLSGGVERPVSGGEVDGRPFYVAAILGGPALFTYAREAARARQFERAFNRAKVAFRRVFNSQLRFILNDEPAEKASALTLMCPLVSRAMDEHDGALEAVCLNYRNAADGFRLGLRTMVSRFIGDWRNDPSVSIRRIRKGEAWGRHNIPAVLDGEPFSLPHKVEIRFRRVAFRALALAETPGGQADAKP